MKIITSSLVVNEGDGFKNDILGRKEFGDSLTSIVTDFNGELVISLDGDWGEGKTTFVKMWQGLLDENEIPNVYVDSFENDYISDPFLTVASAVLKYIETKGQEDAVAEFKDKAKKIGVQLLKYSAKLGVRVATLGVVKDQEFEELKDIGKDVSKDVANTFEGIVESKLDSHSKDAHLIQGFKESLSELPEKLGGKRLVVIIDELDRCRPSYAVEMLEKIKHLFSVREVVFVLVNNSIQMQESVRSIYGQGIDANSYLQKFITIEARFPKKRDFDRISDIVSYGRELLQQNPIFYRGGAVYLYDSINPLLEFFLPSFRQLEKILTNVSVVFSSMSRMHRPRIELILMVSFLKVLNLDVFHRIVDMKIDFDELCNEIKYRGIEERMDGVMKWMKFCLSETGKLDEEEFREYFEVTKYGTSRQALLASYAKCLLIFSA